MQPMAARSPGPAASLFGQMLKTWRGARKMSQLELVLALAESLDVPLRERNALLTAAGFAALYRERSLDGADMTAVRQALELTLRHHEPYPALVVDREWNLLMQNEAATTLLGVL